MMTSTLEAETVVPCPDALGCREARVTRVGDDRHYGVIAYNGTGATDMWARLALIDAPELAVGDRVLVAGSATACYILGVLECALPRTAVTRSGARAKVVQRDGEDCIQVRDAASRLVFEYRPESQVTRLTVPSGDLTLAAPQGSIDLLAGATVRCHGAEGVALHGKALDVVARRGRFTITDAEYQGIRLSATLERAKLVYGRLQTVVGSLIERATNVYRDVRDLHQLCAGRVRSLVQGCFSVHSGRTDLTSEQEVRIDGESINLG